MGRKTKSLCTITRLNIGGSAFHTILLTAHLGRKVFNPKLVKGKERKVEGEMDDLLEKKKVIQVNILQLTNFYVFFSSFCLAGQPFL